MELVYPDVKYKDSYIEAVKEFHADVEYTHRWQWYKKQSIPELEAHFDSFVQEQLSYSRGENLRQGYVPYSVFWLIDNGTFIGQVDIRHKLNDQLRNIGGHIGYDIRPSMRGKEYGNKILELALQKAKHLGIDRALVTHDERNIASQKIIEKNGGVYESRSFNPEMSHHVLRYWIDTK